MLKEGDVIPKDIKIKNQNNDEVSLSDYLDDNYLVIYFYPKDSTPGCTQEACSFRDGVSGLNEVGAKVVGVSKDSIESHIKFIEKNSLNFDLLSDEELKLNNAFGVWIEKSMFGKKYMGTQRSTFIANKEGKIVKVWEKVKPNNHAHEIRKFIDSLN